MRSISMRLLCVSALLVSTVFAQSGNQGSITGTVTDSSGAVVKSANVTATNKANAAAFTTTTNDQGIYNFPVLPVGDYALTVASGGFAEAKRDVIVRVGAKVNLDVNLAAAGASENVTVTDVAPLIETSRAQVANNVVEQQIRELPVNGRNFIDFALLTPGVNRDVRTGDLSFAGQRGTLNSLTVDGADNNNTFFGQTVGRTGSGRAPYQFSQDAVQEFQVISSSYTAEQGRAGGAVINVITKSGTNQFHGSAFEYYRDRGLAANDPVNKQNNAIQHKPAPVKPGYHFNQFGATLGGPIIKNKLFFFFDYDGQRNTSLQSTSLVLPVATTAQETAAINYLNARSAPYTRGLNQDSYLAKGDWNVNGSNLASIRYNRQNFTGKNFENGGINQASEHTGNSLVKTDSLSAQLTSTLTPRLINVARFVYQIDSEPGQANSDNPEATVNFIANATASSFIVGRNSFSPRETTIHRQQYADTATWVHGNHTFKFGADILHDDILNFFPGNFSGLYTFANLQSFGCSLQGLPLDGTNGACPANAGNFLREAFAGTGTTGPETHPNILQTGFFGQDEWRLSSRLTVNAGLRYDVQNSKRPPVENPAATAAGLSTSRLNTDTNNFGPRFGVAWDPWGHGKIVVRGGYGIFYGVTPSIMVGTAHSNNGINVQTLTFSGAALPSYPANACGAPTASPNCAAPTGGTVGKPTIYIFEPDYQQPRVQQASAGVDYQLANDTLLSFGYLFAKGDNLQRTRDINLGTPVATPITEGATTVTYLKYPATRPIAAFNQVFQFESSAHSVYNGLTAQVNKRFTHHFSAQAAYTWSHAIDDAPDATAVVPGADDAKMLYSPLFPQLDRANSVNDVRHRLVANWVWNLDYYKTDRAWTNALVNGWELSGIWTAQSGTPYTGLIASSDLNNDANRATERAANEGRNTFTTPAFFSLDPRLTKRFAIREGMNLQLFAEAFNILNRFNKTSINNNEWLVSGGALVPNNSLTSTTRFGLPRSGVLPLNGARIVQLGAKFNF